MGKQKAPGYKIMVKGDRWTLWKGELLLTPDKVITVTDKQGKSRQRLVGWTKGEVVEEKARLTGKRPPKSGTAAAKRAQVMSGKGIIKEDSQRAIDEAAERTLKAMQKAAEKGSK